MNAEDRQARWLRIGLVAVTALGLALRLYRYGERDPWIDEVDTRLLAASWGAPIWKVLAGPPISTPPLYYWMVRALSVLHLGGAHLRLPSVVLGTAAIPLTWSLARRCGSETAALLAALLIAVSPLHVRYSQQARCFALLTTLTIAYLIALLDERRAKRAALLAALLPLTQYAGVVISGVGAAWLLAQRRDRRTWTVIVGSTIGVALSAVYLWLELGGPPPSVVLRYDAERVAAFVAWFGFGEHRPLGAGVWLIPALALAGLVGLARRRRWEAALLAVTAAAPPLVMIAFSPHRSFFVRYALPALPLCLVLAAIGLADVIAPRRWRLELCLIGTAAFAVLAATPLRGFYRERAAAYAALARTINAVGRDGESVDAWVRDLPTRYYGAILEAALRPPLDDRFVLRGRDPRFRQAGDRPGDWTMIVYATSPAATEVQFPTSDELTYAEADVLGQWAARAPLTLLAPPRFDAEPALGELAAAARAQYPGAVVTAPDPLRARP